MKHMDDQYEMKKEYDLSKGVRGRFFDPRKVSTTIRLDEDIILYLKKEAREKKTGYQTLLNSLLREHMNKGA
jgi:uncharacterized protein (DUF4415 family)